MPLPLPRPFLLLVLVGFTSTLAAQGPVINPPAVQQPDVEQQQPAKQAAEPRYWTTHWSFQDVDVKRLFSRLKSIGIVVPVDGEGDVSVEIDVSIPLTSLSDAKAYRLSGHFGAKRLRLESLLLEDFDADLKYDNGMVRLENVKGRWADPTKTQNAGSFNGGAYAQLLPRGDFETNIAATSLPIGPLYRLLSPIAEGSPNPIRGTLSGSLNCQAPIDQLRQVTAWTAEANLKVDGFQFGETLPISATTGHMRFREGIIDAPQLEVIAVDSPDIRIDLATQIELIGRQRFQFRIRGNDVPLATLTEIVLPRGELAAGKLDIDANGAGELGAPSWHMSGRLASPQLTLLGRELGVLEHQFDFDQQRFQLRPITDAARNEQSVLIKRVSATYQLDQDSLNIAAIDAELFGGTINGTARLARTNSINHTVNLAWDGLRLSFSAATILPAAGPVSAVSSGSIDWSFPPAALDLPAMHVGTARIHLDQLGIGPTYAGDVRVRLEASGGTLRLTSDGRLLGGDAEVEAISVAGQDDSWSTLLSRAPSGYAKAASIRLDAIARVLFPDARRRWRGTASGQLDWQAGAQSAAELKPALRMSVRDIAIDGRSLSRQLKMQLGLSGNVVAIEHLSGSLAGGRLRASGNWSLTKGERRIQISFAGIKADEALLPISHQTASQIDGKVSGMIHVTYGDQFRFRGAITARNSSFFSLPTGTAYSGINGSVSRDLRRWEVSLPSVQGELAGGRIAGALRLSSSSMRPGAFDLSSRWNASRVDFGELLTAAGSSSTIAHGRMTGELSLGGRGVRGTSDLVGRFDARLGATQAAAIPGLMQADQFMGVLTLQGLQFGEGGITGVIGAGAATIDEFWLSSPRVKVWSDGKIYLANQRMDLDVVISTNNFEFGNAQVVAFASQLAIQSVLPVTTLMEVNRILSNRTIHLDFLGTMADPRLRLKPLETLREETARFLLRELLVAASATSDQL